MSPFEFPSFLLTTYSGTADAQPIGLVGSSLTKLLSPFLLLNPVYLSLDAADDDVALWRIFRPKTDARFSAMLTLLSLTIIKRLAT